MGRGANTHLQERDQGGDAQRGGNHCERTGGGVADVLVHVVDVGAHGGDHGGQPCGLGQVGDDLPPLHPRVVVPGRHPG